MLSVTIKYFCMGDAEVFMALGAPFSPDPLQAMLETTQRPDAKTDIQDTIRWYCTHEMVDAGRRAKTMMFFSLPGFQNWQFRYVLMGGTMQLEAVQNDLHLTAVLTPLDSISRQADQLIRCSMHQD